MFLSKCNHDSWIRSRNAGSFLFFLTNLSWISVTAYFAIATWIGWLAHVHDNNHDLVTSKVKPALRFILYNLYITQITFQFIVVAVFWTFLTGTMMKTPTPLSWFVNLNVHGLGLLLLLIDFSLNRIPLYYSQWVAPAVAALLYIGYAWVQHFAVGDDFWIYSFLDTRNRYWYLWYLSLFFIMLAIFCALVAASKWRDRVAKARAREFEERVSLNESV